MTFFTNKPANQIFDKRGIPCTFCAVSYKDILNEDFPDSVIVDIDRVCPSIRQVLNSKRIRCIDAPVETHHGNVIYVFLDASQLALKISL